MAPPVPSVSRWIWLGWLAAWWSLPLHAGEFSATGPTQELKLDPARFLGAVKVRFDLLPTTMSFDLPWHFCAVTENGIKVAHFAAETYDPRDWDGHGADASFEAGMDKQGRYCRVWIERQSAARIVVRVRYALVNSKYKIAHDDLPAGSPYNDGKGDWGDERFTIYPDGTFVRHMRIHTSLAAMCQPFSFFREPPNVVHDVAGQSGVRREELESAPDRDSLGAGWTTSRPRHGLPDRPRTHRDWQRSGPLAEQDDRS